MTIMVILTRHGSNQNRALAPDECLHADDDEEKKREREKERTRKEEDKEKGTNDDNGNDNCNDNCNVGRRAFRT